MPAWQDTSSLGVVKVKPYLWDILKSGETMVRQTESQRAPHAHHVLGTQNAHQVQLRMGQGPLLQ